MVTVGHWKGSTMDHEWLFKDNQDLSHDRVRRLYRRLENSIRHLIRARVLLSGPDTSEMKALHIELESIARAANIVQMRSSDLFFELKSHIDRTRSNLASAEMRNRTARVA